MRTEQQQNDVRKALLSCAVALLLCQTVLSQSTSTVAVPGHGDKYSKLVRQLEAGKTNINYREFRDSFLGSEQFKIAGNQTAQLETLRKKMRALMKQSQYSQIVDVAKQMLSIDYTDMEAHKILQQTYKVLGDAPNQKKYHDIEFGLLTSIVKNGDGRTCTTAWPVIQLREEYFILEMLGARLLKQSIDTTGLCDRMEVQTDRGKEVYYFGIAKVFKGYNERGIR